MNHGKIVTWDATPEQCEAMAQGLEQLVEQIRKRPFRTATVDTDFEYEATDGIPRLKYVDVRVEW